MTNSLGKPAAPAAATLTAEDVDQLQEIAVGSDIAVGGNYRVPLPANSFASRQGGAPAPTHAADAEAGKSSGDRER